MKKYFKNSCKNLVFIFVSCLYLLIILPCHFYFEFDSKITSIIILTLLSPFILYFLIGFYWAFQKITINDEGIQFYLLNKKIRKLSWDSVEHITINKLKLKTYLIKEKGKNRYYNIDATKKIELLINNYAPKELFWE